MPSGTTFDPYMPGGGIPQSPQLISPVKPQDTTSKPADKAITPSVLPPQPVPSQVVLTDSMKAGIIEQNRERAKEAQKTPPLTDWQQKQILGVVSGVSATSDTNYVPTPQAYVPKPYDISSGDSIKAWANDPSQKDNATAQAYKGIGDRLGYDIIAKASGKQLTNAQILAQFTTEEADRLGIIPISHQVIGVDKSGNYVAIDVATQDYYKIKDSKYPAQTMIDLGIYPKGSTITSDVKGMSKDLGITLPEPYDGAGFAVVIPNIEKGINQQVRQAGSLRELTNVGILNQQDKILRLEKVADAVTKGAISMEVALKDIHSVAGWESVTEDDIRKIQTISVAQVKAQNEIDTAIRNLVYAPYPNAQYYKPNQQIETTPDKFTEQEVQALINNNIKPQTLADAGVPISAINNVISKIRVDFEVNVLPKLPKDLQESYNNGIAGGDLTQFQSNLNEYNKQNQEKIDKYNSALKVLDDGGYRSTKVEYPEGGAPFESYTTEGAYGYDATKYLIDTKTKDNQVNPASLVVLSSVYKPEQVVAMKDGVQKYLDIQTKNINYVMEFISSYDKGFADKVVFDSKITELGFKDQFQNGNLFVEGNNVVVSSQKAMRGNVWIATGIGVSYKDFWDNISQDKKEQLANAIANDPRKSSIFAAVMENYNVELKEQGLIGQILPIVGMFIVPELFIPMFAIQAVANVIAPYTVSNKAIVNQINSNTEYYNNSKSLTSDENNALTKALKSNDISVGNNPLQSYQALSDADKQKVISDITRQQLGLNVSTMDKVIAGTMVVASVLPFASPVKLLSNLPTFGKITEFTLRGGIMGVFATNIGMNWNKMATTDKVLNVAMMVAQPISSATVGGIKTIGRIIGTAITEGRMFPAGLKTGGMDLAFIKVPDLFKGIEGKVSEIIANTLPDKQADAIRELLNPENKVKFDAYMNIADSISNLKLPDNLAKPIVNLSDVEVIKGNQAVANGFKMWLQANNNDVYVGGSRARIQQLDGVVGLSTPHDLDFYIKENSELTLEQAVNELANIIRQNAPNADVKVSGTKLSVNGVDTSDIHIEGYAGKNPFGWDTIPKTIIIDGVAFEDIHQLLIDLIKAPTTPTIGKTAGMLFPSGEPFPRGQIGETVFGTIPQRIKDIMAGNITLKGIADAIEKTNPELAQTIKDNLYTIQTTPSGKPLEGASSDILAKTRFLDMVAKAQQDVLTKGINASIVDAETGGTLIRIASPASKIVQGILYTATRDITPFVEAAKQGYFEVGKLLGVKSGELKIPSDVKFIRQVYQTGEGATVLPEMDIAGGKILLDANGIPIASADGYVKVAMLDGKDLWISKNNADVITRTISNGVDAGKYITFNMETVNAERGQLFASLDAAFDFLLDREQGILPDKAGIIGVRTTEADTANLDMVGSPFRYEYDSKGNAIVYDERIVASGIKANSTAPTDFSLSGKGKTDGATGETVTYYPRTKTSVPMLWFATDSAKEMGLGAPTTTEIKAINWLAFKSMVGNILHPHITEDISFTWGDRKGIKGSLLNFYQDTYKWKSDSESNVKNILKVINDETGSLNVEALLNLKKGDVLKNATPEETQKLIDDEVSRIIADRVKNVMENQKVMEELAKTKGDDIVNNYTLDVKELMDGLDKATLVGSISSQKSMQESNPTINRLTNAMDELSGLDESATLTKNIKTELKSLGYTPKQTNTLTKSEVFEILSKTKDSLSQSATESNISNPSTIKGVTDRTTIPTKTTGITKPEATLTQITIPPTKPTIAQPTSVTPSTIPITQTPTPQPPTKKVIMSFIPSEPFNKERIMSVYQGRIAWKQGKLRQGTQLREQWYLISPPYEKISDVKRQFSRPQNAYVVSGAGSAYGTVQQLGYSPRVFMAMDWGMFDLQVQTPKVRGEKAALKFTYDVGGKTRNPIRVQDIQTVSSLA